MLEASDFLNDRFIGLLPSTVHSAVVLRTLGDCADVEVHDLSPCEGLRVFKFYFCRHSFSCFVRPLEEGDVDVWQKPWNQTNSDVTSPVPPIVLLSTSFRDVDRVRCHQHPTHPPLYSLALRFYHVSQYARIPPRRPEEPSGRSRPTADSRVPQWISDQESNQRYLVPGTCFSFITPSPRVDEIRKHM